MRIELPTASFLNQALEASNKWSEQLASGKKVNSGADNVATLQIIARLISQQNGYGQAVSNAHDGIS